MHHFGALGEFKLELQSGNAQFGSKSAIFCRMWPWNLTDDFENNRTPLLCNFKRCASFRSHRWTQIWSYSPETANSGQNRRFFSFGAIWKLLVAWTAPSHYQNQCWNIVNWTLRNNFSEILIGIQTSSFKKMHLKMSSAKWRPFCLGLNKLTYCNLCA